MRVTALEEYGLRCMLILAKGEQMTLPEMMKKEGLSLAYAGKLMLILRRADLVKASRGRRGGYSLAKPAETIMLREIFTALGEPMYPSNYCDRFTGSDMTCVNHTSCQVRHIWQSVDSFIGFLLDRITLADVADGKLGLLESIMITLKDHGKDKSEVSSATAAAKLQAVLGKEAKNG